MDTSPKEKNKKPDKRHQLSLDEIVRQLSEMVDLIEYQDYIGRKTRYGKKPGPTPWHYTEKLLATYQHQPSLAEFIRIFEEAGVTDEVKAAKWVVINDEVIT